ncbi:holin [Paenibacillus selenitireducens]|uniref:Holin n=1 Tax=Paenibacillus selenitireducens TaxID=1324314 RepID=A0A1T2X529_9BACL|nr:phage holin family protein [Paenibacillus selenitireducens]OPA74683.1 holin [Paenibacillus selenitireducens]
MEKAWSYIVGALAVPAFNFFYGGDQMAGGLMMALIFFVVMDWITGIRASKKDNSYASKYGIDGVFRTFFILLLPAGGHLLDRAFQIPDIMFGALAIGVLYHILQSMTANAVRAGWANWFPEWLLVKITNWVKSELEKKVERAESRKGGTTNEGK